MRTRWAVYVGKYPLDSGVTLRDIRSDDGWLKWEPGLGLLSVCHIHALAADPYTGDLRMTTGDTDGECRIGLIEDDHFEVFGAGSQRWREVESVFTPTTILGGVDSVYTESNPVFLFRRGDNE